MYNNNNNNKLLITTCIVKLGKLLKVNEGSNICVLA